MCGEDVISNLSLLFENKLLYVVEDLISGETKRKESGMSRNRTKD